MTNEKSATSKSDFIRLLRHAEHGDIVMMEIRPQTFQTAPGRAKIRSLLAVHDNGVAFDAEDLQYIHDYVNGLENSVVTGDLPDFTFFEVTEGFNPQDFIQNTCNGGNFLYRLTLVQKGRSKKAA